MLFRCNNSNKTTNYPPIWLIMINKYFYVSNMRSKKTTMATNKVFDFLVTIIYVIKKRFLLTESGVAKSCYCPMTYSVIEIGVASGRSKVEFGIIVLRILVAVYVTTYSPL